MTCECYRVAGWSSSVARRAHNPKVVGSNPAPATRKIKGFRFSSEAFFRKRDLFPSPYPQYPCFSHGTTQLSSCGSITMRSLRKVFALLRSRTTSSMACRFFSFAAAYSYLNRSSTCCRVIPSSEATANASETLPFGTTIKTYSSPPVSHSRIVRP